MKQYKIVTTLSLATAIALAGCGAETGEEGTPTSETSPTAVATTASPTPTAEATTTKTPAVAVLPDYSIPNPMNQDVSALVANSSIISDFASYGWTPESVTAGATLGLNWFEQIVQIPTLYDKQRNILAHDPVVVSEFYKAITPEFYDEEIDKLSKYGMLGVIPVPNNEGIIWANSTDQLSVTFKEPAIVEWSDVTIHNGKMSMTQTQPLIHMTAKAKYTNTVLNIAETTRPVTIEYTILVARSPLNQDQWVIHGWDWKQLD